MIATTQLNTHTRYLDYAHLLPILLAEECHGTHRFCFFQRNILVLANVGSRNYPLIDEDFHVSEFLFGHGATESAVESQSIYVYERSELTDTLSERLPQSGVKQMGGCMVGCLSRSAFGIHRSRERWRFPERCDRTGRNDS